MTLNQQAEDLRRACDALEAENKKLKKALGWYAGMAMRMGNAAVAQDSKTMFSLMHDIAVDYGHCARTALQESSHEQ